MEHVDVLIVGAGISGIGAACHLQAKCPNKSYAILEGRAVLGGTWDLFRYPGIRSDSDMYTLGYSFKPWTGKKAIADGASILSYLQETARENDVEKHIRFNHQVKRASWSSRDAKWTIEAERGPERELVQYTCSFLFMASGYYSYESGYTPQLPGMDRFKGRIVHPQKWTNDVDYAGKRVIVIGSGATAVTLVPALAKSAAHVTMLQRSPTYVLSRPAEDRAANLMRKVLPRMTAYGVTRWKQVLLGMGFFEMSKLQPERVQKLLLRGVTRALGEDYDVGTHFTPKYKPWDQRVCLVPDGDFFDVIRRGRATVVTDHIDTFTEQGIKLRSGVELQADLVVTATGLNLEVFGGLQATVDGEPVDFGQTRAYKAMMFSDVPNFAAAFGYTNASWTLKCDLTCAYVCRLLQHMDAHGFRRCVPRKTDPAVEEKPFLDFSSGYVQRSIAKFPKQGTKAPWSLHQNYPRDIMTLRYGKVDDGVMQFS